MGERETMCRISPSQRMPDRSCVRTGVELLKPSGSGQRYGFVCFARLAAFLLVHILWLTACPGTPKAIPLSEDKLFTGRETRREMRPAGSASLEFQAGTERTQIVFGRATRRSQSLHEEGGGRFRIELSQSSPAGWIVIFWCSAPRGDERVFATESADDEPSGPLQVGVRTPSLNSWVAAVGRGSARLQIAREVTEEGTFTQGTVEATVARAGGGRSTLSIGGSFTAANAETEALTESDE